MGEKQSDTALQNVTVAMRSSFPTIRHDASLKEVFLHFSNEGNHPLIVTGADGTYAGMITAEDLIDAIGASLGLKGERMISGFDRFLKGTAQTAADLASGEKMVVNARATITDALRAMERTHSPSLSIIDDRNVPVGCIELADIIAFLIRSGSL